MTLREMNGVRSIRDSEQAWCDHNEHYTHEILGKNKLYAKRLLKHALVACQRTKDGMRQLTTRSQFDASLVESQAVQEVVLRAETNVRDSEAQGSCALTNQNTTSVKHRL